MPASAALKRLVHARRSRSRPPPTRCCPQNLLLMSPERFRAQLLQQQEQGIRVHLELAGTAGQDLTTQQELLRKVRARHEEATLRQGVPGPAAPAPPATRNAGSLPRQRRCVCGRPLCGSCCSCWLGAWARTPWRLCRNLPGVLEIAGQLQPHVGCLQAPLP